MVIWRAPYSGACIKSLRDVAGRGTGDGGSTIELRDREAVVDVPISGCAFSINLLATSVETVVADVLFDHFLGDVMTYFLSTLGRGPSPSWLTIIHTIE